MRVPWPGAVWIASVPPIIFMRSFMPSKPKCPFCDPGAWSRVKPEPSSVTVTVARPEAIVTEMASRRGAACFKALATAS